MPLPTGISFSGDEHRYDFYEAAVSPSSVNVLLAYPLALKGLSTVGRSVGDPFYFTVASGSAPTPLTTATVYYIQSILSSTEVTLSATPGGAQISCPQWTSSFASAGEITVNRTAHGYAANTALRLANNGTFPRGLAAATTYYVKTVVNANSFTLSASAGGAVIAYPTVTINRADPGNVTLTSHGLSVNMTVVFATTGALPSPLVAGTTYYVQSVIDANTFTVSATPGGAAIATTTNGSGTHYAATNESGVYVVDLAANTGTYTVNGYFTTLCRAMYFGSASTTLSLIMVNNDVVQFSNVPKGILPVRARGVATGTITNVAAIF